MKDRKYKKRTLLTILGVVFILCPTFLVFCVFVVTVINEMQQEHIYAKFTQHLVEVMHKDTEIIDLTTVAQPPFVDFQWSDVCASDFYCGTTHCDPYAWTLTFKGKPGDVSYPIDERKFGRFYAQSDLQKPQCFRREEAVLTIDARGLHLIKISTLGE